jgi:hypothetical protein
MKLSKKVIAGYSTEIAANGDLGRNYLKHADPHARLAALLFYRDTSQRPPDFTEVCKQLALEDTDLTVRCCTLTGLGMSHWKTGDAVIGRLLAGFVGDETQPDEFRKLAYFNLFSITGQDDYPNPQTFQFPQDLDWKFVESFLANSEV